MTTINYAFTLRRTTDPSSVTEAIYRAHIVKLLGKGIIINEYTFERTNGLHVHGVMNVPYNYNPKRLRVRGWKIHLELIYNYSGWIDYINKEILNQEYKEQDNYTLLFNQQRRLFT